MKDRPFTIECKLCGDVTVNDGTGLCTWCFIKVERQRREQSYVRLSSLVPPEKLTEGSFFRMCDGDIL